MKISIPKLVWSFLGFNCGLNLAAFIFAGAPLGIAGALTPLWLIITMCFVVYDLDVKAKVSIRKKVKK